ncbi:MAG: hypothetical protein A2252_08175 [Elusimicrobia bacterium RIFOXYA2_FULL_39_19]|nr:MAG: hypothetical protein A2252_08175 [Elusimicrobia bacterium RIFOXYA2_FULL_39_19]
MNYQIFFALFMVFMILLRYFEISLYEKKKTKGEIRDKWTINFLGIAYSSYLVLVVVEFLVVNRQINYTVAAIGMVLWVARFFLKRWGATTLSEFWSADIEIRENHRVIRKGPYKFLRHPVYLSNVIDVIAVALIANAYYMLSSGAVLMVLAIYSRIPFEEKALISKLGDEYRQYRKETYALIPFIL